MVDMDCHNESVVSCLNLTGVEFDTMFYSMIGLFVVSFILSIVAVTMLLIIGGITVMFPRPPPNSRSTNVHAVLQLTLYILVSVFFYNGAELLKIMPTKLNECGQVVSDDQKLCQASGFLLEYFSLLTYVLAFLTTMYIAARFVFHCKCSELHILQARIPITLVILIIGLITPLTIAWIPFVHDNYRLAGAWCWIDVDDKHCHLDVIGLSEEIALYYVLVFGLSFVMFVTAFVILAKICGLLPITKEQQQGKTKGQLEFVPLLIYPIIFTLFFCVDVVQRIHFATSNQGYFVLWMIHAVGGNTTCLLVPLAFIVHPLNLSRIWQKLKKQEPRVPQLRTNVSEVDPLIQSNSSSSEHPTLFIVPVPASVSGEDPFVIQEQTPQQS